MHNLKMEEINLVDGGGEGTASSSNSHNRNNSNRSPGRASCQCNRSSGNQTYGGNGRDTNGNTIV